jgi:hypothetical protein
MPTPQSPPGSLANDERVVAATADTSSGRRTYARYW